MKSDRGDWQKTLRASAAVAASLDPDELMRTVLSLSAEVAHAEDSSVILHDDETGELVIAAATGPHASDVEGLRFPEGAGIAGQVHATGRPRVIADAQAESAHLQDIDRATHHVTRSIMAAPLVVGEKRLGVVEAMNRAAGGPFSDDDLDRFAIFANLIAVALRNARSFRLLRRENESLRRALDDRADRFVAESPAMRRVVGTADRAAEGKSTILLLGETGTGKEQVARRIHRRSPRAARSFVALNCGALPDNLVESELFGHERGAFTGADRRRLGRFELADHGTLFLDEIGELPLPSQVKLLRVLQEREFHRLGGTSAVRIDVRLVAATARDLNEAVREGAFRQDLFFRLNVVPIQIPPLRERREDIEPLARLFLDRFAREGGRGQRGLTPGALARLGAYDWPGNVRELENLVERLVVLGDASEVSAEEVDRVLQGAGVRHTPRPDPLGFAAPPAAGASLWDHERSILHQALETCRGNQSAAAVRLGISRSQLRTRMKRHGLLSSPR